MRGFSRLATVALFVLIAGGSASALLLTNGLESGITLYVWIVLAKLGIVGIAAFMGAFGRRGLGSASRGRYRRLFLLDACLLVVVAFLSSALTLVGPHVGHADHEPTDDGDVAALQHDPGPGEHHVRVPRSSRIRVHRAPTSCWSRVLPAGMQGVTAELLHQFTGGSPVSVTLAEDQRGWAGSVVLPFTGDWTVTAFVRVDTFTEARGTCEFTVSP